MKYRIHTSCNYQEHSKLYKTLEQTHPEPEMHAICRNMFKGHALQGDFHFISFGEGLCLGGLPEEEVFQHVHVSNEARQQD